MVQALRSSETSALTRATRRNIPEDSILHSHRSENLKSYMCLIVWHCTNYKNMPSLYFGFAAWTTLCEDSANYCR
jgi:hypothetical protein